MEFIKSLSNITKETYTAMSDTFLEDFSEMAPIEYGKWHWRSVIVVTGLICSIATFVVSLFYSSALITLTSLIATAILTFSLYYVSRYEEQKRMALLLTDYEKNNERLEEQVTTLEEENSRLATTRKKMEAQVSELSATKDQLKISLNSSQTTASALSTTNSELSSTLEEIKKRETALSNEYQEYVRAHSQGAKDIAANLTSLRELDSQCNLKQKKLQELAARMHEDLERLGAMKAEVQHLKSIREELGGHIIELKQQVTLLQQGAQTQTLNQTALKSLIGKVESILAAHSS